MTQHLKSPASIGKRIREEDNRMTSDPLYAVQERVRDFGFDLAHCDNVAWVRTDDFYEVTDPDELDGVEAEYRRTGEEPDQYQRVGFRDRWKFVTACLTEKGCEEYIRRFAHNLGETRIYVYSARGNEEWIAVRELYARILL